MSLLSHVLGGLGAVLMALCAGALWSVLALFAADGAPWLALAVAPAAALALGFLPLHGRLARAVVALALMLLAIAYAQTLGAASRVARMLGIGFLDALRDMGPEMTAAVVAARLEPDALGFLGAGCALAMLLAARRPSRRR